MNEQLSSRDLPFSGEVGRGTESAQRLSAVVHAVSAGLVFKGPHGEILDCNPAAAEILGLTRDAATGRPSPDPRMDALREDGSPYPVEEWPAMVALRTRAPVRNAIMGFRRPGGDVRWVRLTAVPLARPGAAPDGVVVSLDDVTEERRAWQEAQRRGRQLRLAMECADQIYWELDVATGRMAAGAPWTLLGWAEDEVLPAREAWGALVHADDAGPARAAYRAHVAGETPALRCELRARARDGGWRWLLVRGRALARDAAGRAARLAGTVTDVSETKRLEQRLRESDRLASVGALAAGVAHEVNNPLAYVVANLDFLAQALEELGADRPEPSTRAELRAAIRDALDGASRIKGIVAGLRQFSAPAGTARRPTDPRPQLEAAVGLVQHEIAHRARLRVELPPRLPAVVAGERELTQVLVNLLVHAARSVRGAGDDEIVLAAETRGDRLALTVSDTGCAIPAADLPRLFDPFFVARPSAGAAPTLGLAISHGIVASLGGSVEVTSERARGNTFRVLLPLAPAPAAERPTPPADVRPGRPRVLVVDDEILVGRSLARQLGGAFEVSVESAAEDVLRRARAGESWDVLLCDLMMPGMSGMELEAALAELRPELVPRMLFLTGGAFTDAAREFLDSGRPWLEKPVGMAELRAAVARFAARLAGAGSPVDHPRAEDSGGREPTAAGHLELEGAGAANPLC